MSIRQVPAYNVFICDGCGCEETGPVNSPIPPNKNNTAWAMVVWNQADGFDGGNSAWTTRQLVPFIFCPVCADKIFGFIESLKPQIGDAKCVSPVNASNPQQ